MSDVFSVLAGVYLGLVGVFLATDNFRLNELMVNSPMYPGRPERLTRRSYMVDLLAFGCAVSIIFVMLNALGTPLGPVFAEQLPSAFSTLELSNALWALLLLRFALSTLVGVLVAHQVVLVLLALRFMQRVS